MPDRRADYSNRELEHYFKDFGDTLKRIENQTTATNGKVADIQRWRERTTGAAGVVLIVVVPLLAWGLYKVANIKDEIQRGVSAELSKYDVLIN